MKTQIKKIGDTTVVSVDGKLDHETQDPFKENLKKLISRSRTDATPSKVIFNLENLEFVGSCGITNFVQTLKEFNTDNGAKPRYCGVKSEFRRIMKAFDEENIFEFYDNEDRARKSFDN